MLDVLHYLDFEKGVEFFGHKLGANRISFLDSRKSLI